MADGKLFVAAIAARSPIVDSTRSLWRIRRKGKEEK